jgi:hypothetical protein
MTKETYKRALYMTKETYSAAGKRKKKKNAPECTRMHKNARRLKPCT